MVTAAVRDRDAYDRDGTLGELVDIHNEMHMQHTNARLLPWHRVLHLQFSEADTRDIASLGYAYV